MSDSRLERLVYLDMGTIVVAGADGYADADDVVCYFNSQAEGDDIGPVLAAGPQLLALLKEAADALLCQARTDHARRVQLDVMLRARELIENIAVFRVAVG